MCVCFLLCGGVCRLYVCSYFVCGFVLFCVVFLCSVGAFACLKLCMYALIFVMFLWFVLFVRVVFFCVYL